MATRQQPLGHRRGSRPPIVARRRPGTAEPLPARALQAIFLLGGMTLFFVALFGERWGLPITGLLIVASAFPPLRRHVDRWTVGKVKGEEADQAALMRLAIGVGIVILALLGALSL